MRHDDCPSPACRPTKFKLVLTTSICTAIVVSTLTVSVQALANLDEDPATDSLPRVIPYEGVLDLDGSPYTGFMDMRFSFFTAPTGGEMVWREVWNHEQQRAVQVFAGRFAAALGTFDDGGGPGGSLEDVIADAGPTFLGIEVKRTDEGDGAWVPLAGRQRLNPVPYAMWSARASDLNVAGSATVGGSLSVLGGSTLSTLTVTGPARLSGPANLEGDLSVAGTLTTGGPISDPNGDVVIADGLDVSGRILNGAGNVTIGDNVDLVGNLTLTGSLSDPDSFAVTVADDLTVTGTTFVLGTNDGRPIGNNPAQRALLHGSPSDVLVVNYQGDFEGGTQINGNVVATDNVEIRGTLSDSNSDLTVADNLAVNGGLTVTGDVNLQDCRLCLLYGDDCNQGTSNCNADKAYTCVKLENGAMSPIFQLSDANVDGNDGFKLFFTCDNGENHAATNRGNAPNEGNWPGPAN